MNHTESQIAGTGASHVTDTFVAGVDGYKGGWIALKVSSAFRSTAIEFVDLSRILRNHPKDLAVLSVDIPIGLLDGPRACDRVARQLLGPVRGCSVFPAPCRSALHADEYREACVINQHKTGHGLSRQAWCICPKIREVDEAIDSGTQNWVFEVHPEVSCWAINGCRPMTHRKKKREGQDERLSLLRKVFPWIEEHTYHRPPGGGIDDLLDAAAAAWSALRIYGGNARCVCPPERDGRGLEVAIRY